MSLFKKIQFFELFYLNMLYKLRLILLYFKGIFVPACWHKKEMEWTIKRISCKLQLKEICSKKIQKRLTVKLTNWESSFIFENHDLSKSKNFGKFLAQHYNKSAVIIQYTDKSLMVKIRKKFMAFLKFINKIVSFLFNIK